MALPHTSSYYAATANDQTEYAPLRGAAKADVCVVGGGFSGVATALTLAERGYSVVLLEANRIGWGASGRNGGQVIGGMSGEGAFVRQLGEEGAKLLQDIRYRGNEIIETRILKYAIECDLKHGWMEVAARPRHMHAIREYHDELANRGHGKHVELIEPDKMRQVLGTDRYHGGIVDRRSGHLHPLNLIKGEARAAADLGVAIHEDSDVIEVGGGNKPYAMTSAGRVEANAVVLAGYSEHRILRQHMNGLTFPTGSYIIVTEPLDEATAKELNPRDLAVADSNVVLDYFRYTADRRMLFGGRCNYSNRDPADIGATMLPRLVEVFPQLEGKRVDYTWGGRIDIVLTRIPAIGRLEPNLYYMQGYCGHGVNMTHIAAEIVSDAICGTTERLDVFDRVRQIRLPIGRWAGNQLLALGMLYYRMRDIL